MTRGKIFVLDKENHLTELVETPYVSEDLLQALLATHPGLLAGDQISREAPLRWLLVSREVEVPDAQDAAGRWSLDHLFLDQQGVPTLVEVKRSSDTRLRREVVGQMLDYAANGLAYWPIEKLKALYEADCERHERDPDERLRTHVAGEDLDNEAFWQRVKTNLLAGRIRMIFLADDIPPELRRVVEFLNSQMDPAEVLAIAVRLYQGGGLRTLVPQLFGQTAEAQTRKAAGSSRSKRRWDELTFFDELKKQGEIAHRVGRQLYDLGRENGLLVDWGGGAIQGSCSFKCRHGDVDHSVVRLWTSGQVEIPFAWMKSRPPFDEPATRQELLERMNRVPGLQLEPEDIDRSPAPRLTRLEGDGSIEAFRQAIRWFVATVEGGGAAQQPSE